MTFAMDQTRADIRRIMHEDRLAAIENERLNRIDTAIANATRKDRRVPNYGDWWLGSQAHMLTPRQRAEQADINLPPGTALKLGCGAPGCDGKCGGGWPLDSFEDRGAGASGGGGSHGPVGNVPVPGQVGLASNVGSGDPLMAAGPMQVPDYYSLSEDTWDCWTFGEPTSGIDEWVGWPEIPLIQWDTPLPFQQAPQYYNQVMNWCPPPRNAEVGCFTPSLSEYLEAQEHVRVNITDDDLRAVYTMAYALILKNMDLLEWATCVALYITWPVSMIWSPEQQHVGGFWSCMRDLIQGDFVRVRGRPNQDYTASTVPDEGFVAPDFETGFPRPPRVRIGELSEQAQDAVRDWNSGNPDHRLCGVYRVAVLLAGAELPHICGLDWPRPHAHCMSILVLQSVYAWALKQRYPCISASPCCRMQDADIINPGTRKFWKCTV